MKPFRILIFFLLVSGLLLGIAFVFPGEGISLGGKMKLHFVTLADLFETDSSRSQYTDSLIQNAIVTDDPEWDIPGPDGKVAFIDPTVSVPGNPAFFGSLSVSGIDSSSGTASAPNTISATDIPSVAPDSATILITDPVRAVNNDSLVSAHINRIRGRVYPLEATDRAAAELALFFRAAEQAGKRGEVLRILHYGDSQIENDRMTALLRYRFQKVFGGSGCGMVPAVPLYSGNPTFRQNYEGDWTRYTGFGKRDSTLGHSLYGTMACFTAVPAAVEERYPSIEFAFLPGRRASQFSTMRLFLHSNADSGMITIHYNDTISDTVQAIGVGYKEITIIPGFSAGKVKLEFGLNEGARIYGISFDPEAGVQVDNIAMRGSSGLEFSRFDRQLMDTMLTAVNPGMIIMQFGGNVVPYMENSAAYKRFFKRELRFIKQLSPEVPIVVIGPADMSTKKYGKFVTYETLVPVRNALREAALESDCAFWDMYGAMGGMNSMRNFVLADPPLATSDYIHFTPRGANLMAGMFFDAVMLEYEKNRVGK